MTTVDGGNVSLERTGEEWLLAVHDGCEGAAVVLTREQLVMLFADQGIDLVLSDEP